MKIIWICHFSNSEVRKRLNFSIRVFERFMRWILHREEKKYSDFAPWISNGILEFEKIKDIELHVISPHYGIKNKIEEFEINGVFYHIFMPDDNLIIKRIFNKLCKKKRYSYRANRKIVQNIIDHVNPDLIHMYGAENPYYSITALDVDIKKYPFLVSLQTLMSDPEYKKKNTEPSEIYDFRSDIERKIIKRVAYLGSTVPSYRNIVWRDINPNSIFTKTFLFLVHKISFQNKEKLYDFVYFAEKIEKAVDIAIEVFALACKKYPSLTLNIIGGSTPSYKQQIQNRISELKIEKNVLFSGKLSTHKEVLDQINKSRYALLPLKIDVISGTIREAIYSHLPVITTATSGTPSLNDKRESILISDHDNFQEMAQNMIKLIESPEYAEKLTKNALITANERWNNNRSINQLIEAYKAIIENHNNDTPIPEEIGTKNPRINDVKQN